MAAGCDSSQGRNEFGFGELSSETLLHLMIRPDCIETAPDVGEPGRHDNRNGYNKYTGRTHDDFWRLVIGRSPLGFRTAAAIAIDVAERADTAVRHDGTYAFFPAAASRYRELWRRYLSLFGDVLRERPKPRPEHTVLTQAFGQRAVWRVKRPKDCGGGT